MLDALDAPDALDLAVRMRATPARSSAGWAAALALQFGSIAGRTAVVARSQKGPLTVQRPFYPEGKSPAHVVLLHPPGGVVAGDVLDVRVEVEAGAKALLTTPAATKFYRSNGASAEQRNKLSVRAGAELEWLPQETIVFGGSLVKIRTRAELEPGAGFLGWEILCLGRAASGDRFATGHVRQSFEVWEGARPLFIERSEFGAGDEVRRARWGLAGHTVSGTLVCRSDAPGLAGLVRETIALAGADALFSVTAKRGVIVCRYLGDSTENAKALFVRAWSVLRPDVFGRPACPPRIWLT